MLEQLKPHQRSGPPVVTEVTIPLSALQLNLPRLEIYVCELKSRKQNIGPDQHTQGVTARGVVHNYRICATLVRYNSCGQQQQPQKELAAHIVYSECRYILFCEKRLAIMHAASRHADHKLVTVCGIVVVKEQNTQQTAMQVIEYGARDT